MKGRVQCKTCKHFKFKNVKSTILEITIMDWNECKATGDAIPPNATSSWRVCHSHEFDSYNWEGTTQNHSEKHHFVDEVDWKSKLNGERRKEKIRLDLGFEEPELDDRNTWMMKRIGGLSKRLALNAERFINNGELNPYEAVKEMKLDSMEIKELAFKLEM